MFIDWTDIDVERSRQTGLITRASLLDRAADNFTVIIHYTPQHSPLVSAQTVTFSTGGQTQGQGRLFV